MGVYGRSVGMGNSGGLRSARFGGKGMGKRWSKEWWIMILEMELFCTLSEK